MLFLKKLSAAERDGDHIYALIRGSAENHGGRASSLTAPNPRAQAEVIKAAYREARIDPRTVTYIETHGTGTALGDPIEINGLKMAFGELHPDAARPGEAYCGIGSVKTNIGHLELAAGVAGVIKVVMQLRHRTLAKSLHCEEVNPYIDLAGSPFYIVRETQAWSTRHDSQGRALPRRAGVSSFGFGGVNAHVVLEEYRGPQAPSAASSALDRPAIIVLSARNRDRLRDHAQQLLAHLGAHACSPRDLASIAYTLQVGREAMDHRLALLAKDGDELRTKLAAYLEGAERGELEGCWVGQVRRDKDTLAVFDADEDLQEAVGKWLRRGKYTRLLELWVKGLAVDWCLLYGDAHPPRVPLPTYPFAKERYWVGPAETLPAAQTPVSAALPAVPAAQPLAKAPAPRWLKVAERWVEAPPGAQRDERNRVVGGGNQRVLVLYRHEQDVVGIRRALAQAWAGDTNRLLVDALQLPDGPASAAPLDGYLAAHRAPDAVFWFSGAFADPSRELAGVLLAIQTLMNRAAAQTLQFFYCYPHTGSEEQIHQEGLSGLFRAAALEWPSHCYRTIEYPAGGAPQDYAAIVREWAGQATANHVFAQVPMVRHRDGKRQVTRLVELAVPEPVAAPVKLRHGGTYLMVGALGEVGLSVCCALARSHAPRLVILSRRPADAELARQLKQITDAGAQVIHRSVDVTDEDRLAQTLAALNAQIGPIHGVFHLARAVDDGPLKTKRVDSFDRTIAAKVRGTLNVDKLTAGEPLDFFLAFSSMAAFGIEGSADYGYSTAFQNAFVRDRNLRVARGERSGRSLALCWGQWRVDAYASEQRLAVVKRLGFDLIEASQAVPLIEAALQDSADVVGIMAVNDARQVRQLYGLEPGLEQAALPSLGRLLELAPELDRARTVLLEQSSEQLAALYASLTS
jgi:NAD(P)-dependent dehydrogenase (short-subunit alcohol dehydrogenase family)